MVMHAQKCVSGVDPPHIVAHCNDSPAGSLSQYTYVDVGHMNLQGFAEPLAEYFAERGDLSALTFVRVRRHRYATVYREEFGVIITAHYGHHSRSDCARSGMIRCRAS